MERLNARVSYKHLRIISSIFVFASCFVTAAQPEPKNHWTLYHEFEPKVWSRQNHAGVGYDPLTDSIYLFGSDTHGNNHDNSVYQFDLAARRWLQHYPPSPIDTYRINQHGVFVAGDTELRPWAMHSFDNITFDPIRRSLIITSFPEHNPLRKRFSEPPKWHTWLYNIDNRSWSLLNPDGTEQPKAFASASAYDSSNNKVILYKWRVWSLASSESNWRKDGPGSGHQIHYTMEYDNIHQLSAIFGDHKNSNVIHVYHLNDIEQKSTWKIMKPTGDTVPEDQHIPVAFDTINGVFLLAPDDTQFITQPSGYRKPIRPKRAKTFVYNYSSNRYTYLPNADLPPLGMNYTMVYSPKQQAFFILSGTTKITVWRLKLDLTELGIESVPSVKQRSSAS